MTRHTTHRLGLLAALLLVASVVLPTTARAEEELVSNVPFAFQAGGRTFAPGVYTLRPAEDQMLITLYPERGPGVPLLSETKLAEPENVNEEGRLVFDKVGETYFLSEMWLPEHEGYLLHSTKEAHTHVKVRLGRPTT